MNPMAHIVSERALTLNGGKACLLSHYKFLTNNLYDENKNPNGICNLGVAENELCTAEITDKLNTMDIISTSMNHYGDPLENFRITKQVVTPSRMIITGGASGGFVLYSYLLADPGDAILIPSPYYTMLDHHAAVFTQNEVIRCPLLQQDTGKFHFSVEIFQRGYAEARALGLRPRIIVLINPHNPLGDVYDESMIRPVLEFAAQKQMHVIIDEIYALSVFNHEKQFESILNFDIVDPVRTHFLWSFSKDFALSGAHVGVMYTGAPELCDIASELNFLWTPGCHIQAILTSMLQDKRWIAIYVSINRTRLKKQYDRVKTILESFGVLVRSSDAGFFIWADFRSFLRAETFDEELQLFNHILNCGVYIRRGYDLGCSQPGWFRLVFSLKAPVMEESLKRLREALFSFSRI